MQHYLYVLVKNDKPIYFGITNNIKRRLSNHKSNGKDFDTYVVIRSFDNKKEALAAENTLTRFNSIFKIESVENARHVDLVAISFHKAWKMLQ